MLRFFGGPVRLRAVGLAWLCAAGVWGQRPHTAPVVPAPVKPPPGDTLPIDTTQRHRPPPAPRVKTEAPRDTGGGDTVTAQTLRADSLRGRAEDSARVDSLRDSVARLPRFGFASPYAGGQPCRELVESLGECWRRDPGVANQEIGFPGTRGWTLSLSRFDPLPFHSVFFPAWRYSPYLSGGLAPPEQYRLPAAGGQVQALEEVWHPVAPLDTPVTRLAWERGALSLNIFHLKLKRMLSARSYLGLDYYSASGDSQNYDYPFNVHQPYLGGWVFLGQIYRPIDRDSASLVIDGISHSISALEARPRLGFWLTPNQAVEIFLDRVRNNTSLTLPRGPSPAGSPGRADSVQALVPNGFKALTQGLVYAAGGSPGPEDPGAPGGPGRRFWTSQWEFSHASVEKEETVRGDSARFLVETMTGEMYQGRGKLSLPGVFGAPELEGAAGNENWEGPLFTAGAGAGPVAEGWSDRQSLRAALNPRLGWLGLEAEGSLGRAKAP